MTVNSVENNPFAFLNGGTTDKSVSEQDAGELALEDFMSLMTTQLQNQNPLEPMDNGEFLGQIASFGTVSGIGDLQKSFDSFAKSMQSEQALQGSSLVGRSVLIPSATAMMTVAEGIKGEIKVTEPVTDLVIQIYNQANSLVRTIEMGTAEGATKFTWDGLDEQGEVLTSGVYQIKAFGTVNGDNTAFATSTVAKVDSVLVNADSQGLVMNLAGIGSVSFSKVQEII